MTIKMDEGIRAIWFIQLNETTDWLLGINEQEKTFEVNYRFRYYNSDDPFDKDDEKNWYGACIPKTEETVENIIAKMRKMFTLLQDRSGEKGYELIRGEGNFDTFLEQFKELPFVHMTNPMGKEEYEEYEKTGDMPAGAIPNT